MSHVLRTDIEIFASAERIWSILSDFRAYPSWNPFLVSLDGLLEVGARLVARIKAPGGRAMTIKPRVTRLERGRLLVWRGSLPIPGLFIGEHSFELVPAGDGRVRFEHSEQFSGLLVPLLRKTLDRDTRAGFCAMNEALKTRAEAPA